ncbi:MAG: three-Cys-motif partner protein TcmP [Chloroflexota bacterium]
MSTPRTTLWKIEPHTKAKHEILGRYLGAWFGILGQKIPRIVYIDGFCGPGKYEGGENGSPIIALQKAKPHAENYPDTQFVFIFIDERSDRIDNLKELINQENYPTNMLIFPLAGEFESQISQLLSHIKSKGTSLAPTFAFIDPFGFSGVPFDLVEKLLKNPKTEILINIMADSINRFAEHPDPNIQNHIVRLFGTPKILDVLKNSTNRFQALRCLYQEQLESVARFVRFFEMRDENSRIIYYLFFASNHPLGHQKIKEAFWKVDQQNGCRFSDSTNPDQLVLFENNPSVEVEKLLQQYYKGQTVTRDQIFRFINDKTSFIEAHAKQALKQLEQSQKIEVKSQKTNGSTRKKGTFPLGTIITF